MPCLERRLTEGAIATRTNRMARGLADGELRVVDGMMFVKLWLRLALVVIVALVPSACGSDDDSPSCTTGNTKICNWCEELCSNQCSSPAELKKTCQSTCPSHACDGFGDFSLTDKEGNVVCSGTAPCGDGGQ